MINKMSSTHQEDSMMKNYSFLEIRKMAENQTVDLEPKIIGTPKTLPEINEYLSILIEKWNLIRGQTSKWQFWSNTTANMHKAIKFLLLSVDGLIILVDRLIESGPDKKATVLEALNTLYDYVVREAIPFWLRPFAGVIKNSVIFTLASSTIDWIVSKYREGFWRK